MGARGANAALARVIEYFTLACICVMAVSVRLFSVIKYESVIHEFGKLDLAYCLGAAARGLASRSWVRHDRNLLDPLPVEGCAPCSAAETEGGHGAAFRHTPLPIASADPYFNYRVTQFLTKEGFYNLWNWFDDRTWYPLGRVVGGTVYPVGPLSAMEPSRADRDSGWAGSVRGRAAGSGAPILATCADMAPPRSPVRA